MIKFQAVLECEDCRYMTKTVDVPGDAIPMAAGIVRIAGWTRKRALTDSTHVLRCRKCSERREIALPGASGSGSD